MMHRTRWSGSASYMRPLSCRAGRNPRPILSHELRLSMWRGGWRVVTRPTVANVSLSVVTFELGDDRNGSIFDGRVTRWQSSTKPHGNAGPNGRFRGKASCHDATRRLIASSNSSHWVRHRRTTEISLEPTNTQPQRAAQE